MQLRRLLVFASVLLGFSIPAFATELPVSNDAYVNSTRTTTNFGAQSNLYVDSGNTTYIQFDLSGLPSTLTAAQIAGAKVTFFVNRINTAGSLSVAAVTSTWNEGSVTYGTKPTVSTTVSATASPAVAGTYVTLDLTALVQAWIGGTQTNYGIALTSTGGAFVLDSKENDQTAHAASINVTTASGTTLSTGSAAGQVYLTGASGAVPTTPVSITGDITLASSGIAAIAAAAGQDIVNAIDATATSAIAPNKLGAGSGSPYVFLNGVGGFAPPIVLTTNGSGAATFSGNTLNIPTAGVGVGSVTYTNGNSTGSASVSGTNLAINFPNGISAVSATNGNATGSVSLSGSNLAVNFPLASAPVFSFYGAGTTPGSGTSYIEYGTNGPLASLGSANIFPVPAACTVSGFTVSGYTYSAGSTGDAATFTVYTGALVNGTGSSGTAGNPSAVSCSITYSTGVNTNPINCSSPNTVSLSQGQGIAVQISENGNGSTDGYYHYAVSFNCR